MTWKWRPFRGSAPAQSLTKKLRQEHSMRKYFPADYDRQCEPSPTERAEASYDLTMPAPNREVQS